MYDSRRVENVRSNLRIVNRKKKKNVSMTPEEVLNNFKNLNLGDNLGVTCYGYTCNPLDPTAPWSPSYHRFGRSWFCSDVDTNEFQLPFGCYNDRCAPPVKSMSHPNYHQSNSGTDPSRIRGELEVITVNNICTNVLQKALKYGTQGRFGHVRTAYKGQTIGKMTPSEVFNTFTEVRQATGPFENMTTTPYKVILGRDDKFEFVSNISNKTTIPHQMAILSGPELEVSILHSISAAKTTNTSLQIFKNQIPTKMNLSNVPDIYNEYENMSNSISKKEKSELIYNINKLKSNTDRAKELRKHLQGISNQWNSSVLGAKKVTGYNMNYSKLKGFGAGLKRTSKDLKRDSETLDENFMMIDGDIFTNCNPKIDYLMYGGSERALGITKKFVQTDTLKVPVVPLRLPLNVRHGSYNQIRKRSYMMFNSLLNDATSGVAGLVSRQMQNVCIPIFQSGSLMKGTHFNDLMNRFLSTIKNTEEKGESLQKVIESPQLYNILKCLQFYIYLHVGLTTREALTEIAKYQSRRNAKSLQYDMFTLATKLRLLGNSGPMSKKMFQKIVRQYILTSEKDDFMQPEEVRTEIEELQDKLVSFKVFGKRISRQAFLPSFLGGKQRANKSMGVPNKGFNNDLKGTGTAFEDMKLSVTKPVGKAFKDIKLSVTKPMSNAFKQQRYASTKNEKNKEKLLIGSGRNNGIIENTSITKTRGKR